MNSIYLYLCMLLLCMHTDGSNYLSLIIPDGGFRNPVTLESFEKLRTWVTLLLRLSI